MEEKRWPARLYDLLRFAAHVSAVGDNVRGRLGDDAAANLFSIFVTIFQNL